ncbi:BLUF domain-containing protein [Variovorax sp. YR752]|uniref:BLUF domain-containing protein n=1 Tax=Variovorax sp. YR752 TaxID=1884383 RepID=UPI0031377248
MSGLQCLLYMSRATREMTALEVDALLERARVLNAAQGVTGALLHYDSRFVQVLEGAPAAVESCFERILGDPRHEQITRLHSEMIAAPRFPDWSMRYVSASGQPDRAVVAFLGQLQSRPSGDSVRQAIALLQRLSGGSPDWPAR